MAQLLNERELVINIGLRDGVDSGMRFAVLAATPLPVHDPETGELLGQLDREKVKVQVVEVLDRMSICRTFETHIIEWYDQSIALGLLAATEELTRSVLEPSRAPETRQIPVVLHAAKKEFPAPLTYEETFVKIGDRVRLIAA